MSGAAIALDLLSIIVLASCAYSCHVSLLSVLVSPDHARRIVTYSCDRSPMDNRVEVSLLAPGTKPSGRGNVASFGHFDSRGFEVQGLNFLHVRWIDNRHVEIAYPDGTRVNGSTYWNPIPVDEVDGVNLSYRPDPPLAQPVLKH